MKRRTFLKNILGGGLATGYSLATLGSLGLSTAHAHHGGQHPTLVVIFQRGGCDGLNTVVPFGDPDYYNLRPSISIAEPNASDPAAALLLNDPLNNHNNFFGLHPSLSPLMSIYNAGNMAVLPTVQYPSPSHSHFDSQRYIESGIQSKSMDGWLNRHLANNNNSSRLQAVGFGSELAQSLRGQIPVQSFSSINSFNLGLNLEEENALFNSVLPVYNELPTAATAYQQLVHSYGQVLFNNLDIVSNINTDTYIPENGSVYPNTTYGRRLRETAQLIKEDVGLELVTVDIGGWDTHSNQGGGDSSTRMSRRLNEFSKGINALYTDLGTHMDNVIILTMTEFGRTAKENGSAGTDHGEASSWFMIGNNIRSGIYGEWPGLTADALVRGRYLQYSIDYRDIFSDILINHLGHSSTQLDSLLPGHSYQPLGLFS